MNSKAKKQTDVTVKSIIKNMYLECLKTNAKQSIARFEKCGMLAGWTFAIIVQHPDFKPCKGEIKI